MSYSVYLQRFDGEDALPLASVRPVLERYGQLGEGAGGRELRFANDEIAEVADVHIDDEGSVVGITLTRPTGDDPMLVFVFEVMRELRMYFFTQDCEAIWAIHDEPERVVPDLLEQAGGRFVLVDSAKAVWQEP